MAQLVAITSKVTPSELMHNPFVVHIFLTAFGVWVVVAEWRDFVGEVTRSDVREVFCLIPPQNWNSTTDTR